MKDPGKGRPFQRGPLPPGRSRLPAGPGIPRPDIRRMGSRGEARELLGLLRGSGPGTMSDVLDALVGMGEPAVPALVAALRDADEPVHMVASIALEKIGKPSVIPLIHAFREKDGLVRVKIAGILADIGEPALDEMAKALRDPDGEVRVLAALALGEMRNPRAIDHLAVALRDESAKVRAQAAISLGELGAPGTEGTLAGVAEKDPDQAVRQVAANALVRIRGVKEDRAASR